MISVFPEDSMNSSQQQSIAAGHGNSDSMGMTSSSRVIDEIDPAPDNADLSLMGGHCPWSHQPESPSNSSSTMFGVNLRMEPDDDAGMMLTDLFPGDHNWTHQQGNQMNF